jgi:hypothetical protein
MTDDRMSLRLITDVLGVLDRHGSARGDNEHTGRTILLISDLACIYEGSQDEPVGPYIGHAPYLSAPPEPPGPESHTTTTVPPSELKTVLGIHHGHAAPPGPPRQASLAADKEVGQ